MKTKLILAAGTALLLSTAAMAAQSDNDGGTNEQRTTVKTVTTTKHINDNHGTWYKRGGVVPVEYRDDSYVVTHWQTDHLNEPTQGSHWVRGANGDFLLINEGTGEISSIVTGPNQH